ncbi:MAG: T9SS type A sorting domain-containing protein [Ignavibacteriales bacterium]|nr:T9SS type A sorting domain-containing protein [Ignavibacteriales bacterium]MCF8306705.1 T9SS type A sorting domain-containing protein [Ignavibacteriales bacterium]MCF8316195.1 T9SS type A sorting domain-containing protein [Ignavibacteriales bacterium]MCF8437779.1 T9SS type A sorting domain-containing protein [Ignavibacteriales bacterium]
MKKLMLLLLVGLYIVPVISKAQPWIYNFGTSTGTYNTASGISTDFLSNPELNAGNDRVRIGTQGGSWNLEDQVISFGGSSYLRGVAPTGTSVNKFSIYDYTGAKSFTMRFKIRLGDASGSNTATAGTWSLFIGDGSGYSDNTSFSGSQVFTGIRFVFGASGAITASYRNGASWTQLSGTPFVQGVTYTVDIYGNNTTSSIDYTYSTSQSVASNKFDLWIDGVLVGDDLSKAQLANNVNIDSWMIYGESSASNQANIFLDDFDYTNSISDNPLPVELTSFTAASTSSVTGDLNVVLNWQTATEVNNYGFEIERSCFQGSADREWETIGFVPGYGNTNSPKRYDFIDEQPYAGSLRYRLKQIDTDGEIEYSNIITLDMGHDPSLPMEFTLYQNYPNPFNPLTVISFELPEASKVTLQVFNTLGEEVAVLANGEQFQAGSHQKSFDAGKLTSGMYLYKITTSNFTATKKMMLIK